MQSRFKQTLSVIDKSDNSKEDYIEDFRASFIESMPDEPAIDSGIFYSNIASRYVSDYFGSEIFVRLTVLSNLRWPSIE